MISDALDRIPASKRLASIEGIKEISPITGLNNKLFTTKPRQSILSLGKPPGRKENLILNDWVKEKMSSLDKSSKDYLQTYRIINEFCLLEYIRQDSILCIEKGNLLKFLISNMKLYYSL